MTQPCHKDTALNQQCCDNEHKDRRGERGTVHPPHFSTHNKHGNTRQKRNGNDTRGTDNVKGGGRHNARCQPQPEHGDNTQPTTPAIQRDHHANKRGTPHTRRGGQQHNRPSLTTPPTIRHAAPPSTTAPPTTTTKGEAHRGYPTTRTAQTHTHHPHTTHPAMNSARHDSGTRQHCNEMSRARATPLHRARQQQHTPPPFHTPRRTDTIHSSTHLLSLHSCSHNR